ncbi:DUF6473 family protein [Tabrizicola aquatica]|uniref:DUF6473 family protein n=1 Tax=Tabrizicola aquatica TaxID=909926 RepID=UPI000CD32236|nr:DUF6473 family protein [Tabrizicola aquatica]
MMSIPAGAGALDYTPCCYGSARSVFRGPECDLSGPYLAMLGGSVTFGKYVPQPFPALVEKALALPVANLAMPQGGPDAWLADPVALRIAARARLAVVQVTGAEGLSNPLYRVHSRRNDRVLGPTPALRALYPDLDLTEIHFTRHLVQVLQRQDPARFAEAVTILRETWRSRMLQVLTALPDVLVLWLVAEDAAQDPLFIDRALVDSLRPHARVLALRTSAAARAAGTTGMIFPETEAQQAACLPGPAAHAEIAAALAGAIRAQLEMATGAA